jgi:hypothetical protein
LLFNVFKQKEERKMTKGAEKALKEKDFDVRVWREDEKRMFFPESITFGTKRDGTHGVIAISDQDGRLTNPDVCVIMRSTGKKDSNGRKIWEGDVAYEGCNGFVREVVWDAEKCTYILNGLDEYGIDSASTDWEVIGNAYEDPDLALEGMSPAGWSPENAGLIDGETRQLKPRDGKPHLGDSPIPETKETRPSLEEIKVRIRKDMDAKIAEQSKYPEGSYERNLGYIEACDECLVLLSQIKKTED